MNTYLNPHQLSSLVEAIKSAEELSTGEIRVHIDSTTVEDNAKVAFEVFKRLCKGQTREHNAVLFHVNFEQKYLTIIGDEGIHAKVHQQFWDLLHDEMSSEFAKGHYFEGLRQGILKTGEKLQHYFPLEGKNPNELSNEITFS